MNYSFSGFVYYETDCYYQLRNPYIPINVENPTLYQKWQRNLTGEGREEREESCKNFFEVFDKVSSRKRLSKEEEEISYRDSELLCSDISRERKRIGGNWAIAGVLLRKKDRDNCRWKYRIFISIKE